MKRNDPHKNIYEDKKTIFINNLLGGLAWAIGVTFGISILVATLAFLAKHINFIPIVGNFVSQISQYVAKTTHH